MLFKEHHQYGMDMCLCPFPIGLERITPFKIILLVWIIIPQVVLCAEENASLGQLSLPENNLKDFMDSIQRLECRMNHPAFSLVGSATTRITAHAANNLFCGAKSHFISLVSNSFRNVFRFVMARRKHIDSAVWRLPKSTSKYFPRLMPV